MRFLVDNQLPGALAVYLPKKGLDSEHVLDAGLANCRTAALLKAFEQVWLAAVGSIAERR